MASFGGDLKRKEKLNGRFGDILSALYLGVCVLRKFEEESCKKEDEVTKALFGYGSSSSKNSSIFMKYS